MIPKECDKCKDLRGVDQPTLLEMCEDRSECYGPWKLCEYHSYEMFDMCSKCFAFIQDPKNDQQLQKWESQHGKS